MDITVLAHPAAEDLDRIRAAIDVVNHLQGYFRLKLRQVRWLPNSDKMVSAAQYGREMRARCRGVFPIAVINNPFDDNYFSHEHRDWMAITVWDWEALYAPPSLKTYLVYQFAGGLLNFAADLSREVADNLAHKPSIGCFFDFCAKKPSIRLGMVGANLCGQCEAALLALGLPIAALRAVERILAHVRAETIRRPLGIPQRVFIGHGRDDAWKELAAFLTKQLDLDVIEFNRDPTAGIATTERLIEMRDQTCFALIVMTGEDSDIKNAKHARLNVIHEAGFFQGYLGFKRAIILLEEGCERFSNIDGLTYISFPKTKILRTKTEIVATLKREGVI